MAFLYIPPHTRNSFIFSLRVAYTSLISLVLINYWPWVPLSPLTGYLSPVLAIITAAKFVGHAQESLYHTIYITVIFGGIGTLISLIVTYPLDEENQGNNSTLCITTVL